MKYALWRVANAWNSISKEVLSNAWHKLWYSTFFLEDDAYDKSNEFRGFCISAEKLLINDLLNYAKEATYKKRQFLDEESITNFLTTSKAA